MRLAFGVVGLHMLKAARDQGRVGSGAIHPFWEGDHLLYLWYGSTSPECEPQSWEGDHHLYLASKQMAVAPWQT